MINKRIKIVQIITRLIQGGAQKVCLDITQDLNKDKYEVYLVSGKALGSEGSLWGRAEKINNIKIKIMANLVRNISPIKDFLALINLHRFFINFRPQIVHCHTSKAGFLGCLASYLAKVPVIIYSSHGHIFADKAKIPGVSGSILRIKLFYLLRKFASSLATKIIALNEADKREQVDLKLSPKENYEVIYNGIEVKDKEKALKRQDKYPVLATIGRLTPEKGHKYLLEAVKLSKDKYKDIKLLVIGDGPQKRALKNQVKMMGISENVIFLGIRTDLDALLSSADIFILPSLYEAFGIVLLDAMLAKKPVIASRVNGIPEVVDDGKTGILVEPGDIAALSEKINILSDNKELSDKMGQAGYKRLNEMFRQDQMIDKFDRLYIHLLEKNK